MNILLVDDNLLMQQVLDRFLGTLGYSVAMVGRADEAVELARRSPPALILLDLHLPDSDGPLALERIRALPGCESIPVIGISGMDEQDARQIMTPSFTAYLPKPIDLDVLEATVRQYVAAPDTRSIG